jgi:hypothetical protein
MISGSGFVGAAKADHVWQVDSTLRSLIVTLDGPS